MSVFSSRSEHGAKVPYSYSPFLLPQKLRMALDFDFDSDAAYNNDLAEALKDIRAEYQAQLEAIRGDSDDSW